MTIAQRRFVFELRALRARATASQHHLRQWLSK
jgi:hypothetical protein